MKDNINILDLVTTVSEVSKELNIHSSTVRKWIEQGKLEESEYRKAGREWIILKSAIERMKK